MIAAAAEAAPEEACGLLLGQHGRISAMVPARNVATDRSRSFEIDPAVLLKTHREARAQGLSVVGHWHSHPNGAAQPSRRDAARAVENGQLWLIVASGQVSGFQAAAAGPVQGRFMPIALEIG